MSLETIILYVIIAVVLIVIPVVLARKTGQNPMELIFGERVRHSAFGKKEKETKASPKSVKPAKRETNSSRNDLLDLISHLATYARRNHFRLIVPGTLTSNGETAVLAALLITRSMAVGINCFGFGGTVHGEPGDSDWSQTLNGEKITFSSPVAKNRKQRDLVQQVIRETGREDVPVEIIGVFTSPSVKLSVSSKANCYTKTGLYQYLQKERFLADRGLVPEELEKSLEPKVLRAEKK